MHSVIQVRIGDECEILTESKLNLHTICACTHLNLKKLQLCSQTIKVSTKNNIISMKTSFKEPIFTDAEGKSPVCDSTNFSVSVRLSEYGTVPAELPAMWKVT